MRTTVKLDAMSAVIVEPSRSGVQVEETRTRVRGGVHWEGQGGGALFYGVTWLGEEFEGQREGQVVGSLQFRLRF